MEFLLNNRELQVPSFSATAHKCEGVFETLNMITRLLLQKFINQSVPHTHDMATLPQLVERDIHLLDGTLREFIAHTEATTVLIIDKGGFLITHQGDAAQFDLTTIGALASGAFMANQTIAGLVNESNFNSIYQQGEKFSMFVVNVDEHCMLVVIFKPRWGGGGEILCGQCRETPCAPAQNRA